MRQGREIRIARRLLSRHGLLRSEDDGPLPLLLDVAVVAASTQRPKGAGRCGDIADSETFLSAPVCHNLDMVGGAASEPS